MAHPDTLAAETPVLVGVGVVEQRMADPLQAREASALMAEAAQRAAQDAGSDRLLTDCDLIMTPQGMWGYSDPGRLVANAIGAGSAQTLFARFGILQQTLMREACRRISESQAEVVMVTGGEARYRQLQAEIKGVEITETPQTSAPDELLEPAEEMWLEAETQAGLGMPVGFYALMETARRHARGLDVETHRDQLAALYARFADIAVTNPHAWKRQAVAAEAIRNASEKNRMLAFPYTKLHNTSWNVDQAAALIFCSAAKAEALGLPRSQWVFPLASVESNHMVSVSQHQDLSRSFGAEIAGQRVLELAGIGVDQLDYVDLYSCFPVAVQLFADALGLKDDQDRTFTGGMPFAGGPLNNYVLQASCRLVELLREKPGSYGLVSSVSGLLTKQGFGIFSRRAPAAGFLWEDVTDEVAQRDPPLEVLNDYAGAARIAAYTVLFQGDAPWRMVAVCDVPESKRAVAYAADPGVMQRAMTEELCGIVVNLRDGQLQLA
jgi:acetyl-CoA C-acetyltransferase